MRGSLHGPARPMSSMCPGSWTSPWRSCPTRGQCISGKSRVHSAKGKQERWSVGVTVKEEMAQHKISEAQVRSYGCLWNSQPSTLQSPKRLCRTQQWPPGNHSRHSSPGDGFMSPVPAGIHTVVPPAWPFQEPPRQGQKAPEGTGYEAKFLPPAPRQVQREGPRKPS